MGFPVVFRLVERWLGVFLCFLLALSQGYFILGLYVFSVDEYVDLEPNVTFEDVRPVIEWPLETAIIIAFAGAALATMLAIFRSRWAFAAILVHFIAAKTAWVLSTFLPYYDGGAIGAWLTVIQMVAIVLIFRTTTPFRSRPVA